MRRALITGCLMLLSVAFASAQQITFASATPFSVGNASLPAGMYFISPTDGSGTFKCVATSGSPVIYFEADATDQVPSSTGVTFMQYGKNMVLKTFSVSGVQEFYITASLPEKQHKKTGAKPIKITTSATTS
jgi:hypothetical protein